MDVGIDGSLDGCMCRQRGVRMDFIEAGDAYPLVLMRPCDPLPAFVA